MFKGSCLQNICLQRQGHLEKNMLLKKKEEKINTLIDAPSSADLTLSFVCSQAGSACVWERRYVMEMLESP